MKYCTILCIWLWVIIQHSTVVWELTEECWTPQPLKDHLCTPAWQIHWICMHHPSPYHIRLEPMWRESKGRSWQHCYIVRNPYSCVLNSTFTKWTCAIVWHRPKCSVTESFLCSDWYFPMYFEPHVGTLCLTALSLYVCNLYKTCFFFHFSNMIYVL